MRIEISQHWTVSGFSLIVLDIILCLWLQCRLSQSIALHIDSLCICSAVKLIVIGFNCWSVLTQPFAVKIATIGERTSKRTWLERDELTELVLVKLIQRIPFAIDVIVLRGLWSNFCQSCVCALISCFASRVVPRSWSYLEEVSIRFRVQSRPDGAARSCLQEIPNMHDSVLGVDRTQGQAILSHH